MKRDWPDWRGQIAAVVASGPSALHADMTLLRDKVRVIAVNNSHRLVPWADVLYATDKAWWNEYRGVESFGGLRVCCGKGVDKRYPGIKSASVPDKHDKRRPTFIREPKGLIGSGGNSGFQAINLAIQFGSTRIMLIGFDMNVDNGLHWHGSHVVGLRNPEKDLIAKWARTLDAQHERVRDWGIDMVNVSPTSALVNYRKQSIEETLQQWTKN